MTESKLITLLRTLNKEEMRRFGKFLEGTAERKSLDRIAFFNYLEKYHPVFPEKKVKRNIIAQKLFPKNEKRLKKIENLMHKIVSILEDFMAYEELKTQQSQRDFLILEAYKRRQLDKFFFKKIEKIEEEWERKKPEGIEQLHKEYLIKKMCLNHPNYSIISQKTITQDNLIHRIDKYYFAVKLHGTLCSYTNQNFVIIANNDSERRQHFIQEILSLCQQSDFQNTPQIKLFSELYEAFTAGNFENYNQIKQGFMANLNLYTESEKNDILLLLTNICYANHREGRPEAIKGLFKLNQIAVEHKLILENGYISHINFRNVVNISCAARELDWAEEFMDNYSSFLQPDASDDIIILCRAVIDFNRGNCEEALSKLVFAKFQDVFYNAQARATMLQCYYELDSELFFSSADSFSGFLNRNKALSPMKKAFSNFIRFVKKLKKAEHEFRADVKDLSDEIVYTNDIVHRSWLISKAELLRQNK